MSQVFTIKLEEGLTEAALDPFLARWASVGSYSPAEIGYNLVGGSGETVMVAIENGEIVFQGNFGDEELSIIDEFAESLGVELLYEGEPLRANEGIPKWKEMGPVGKSLSILGGLVLLPLAIVLLPILLIVLIVRLAITLFTAERRVR